MYLMATQKTIASDIYEPLIQLWLLIRDKPQDVVSDYTRQWQLLQSNIPDYFYEVRERFNYNPNPLDLNFLTRTCVNGIVRFNRDGAFNTSFHLSRKGMNPQRFSSNVNRWHPIIQNVEFQCADYQIILSDTNENDFVYLDPPYAGSHMIYTDNLAIDRFFCQLEELNNRNVKWALSFDGYRGDMTAIDKIPRELYRRHSLIKSGNSPVDRVMNHTIKDVYESLYLNY